MEFQEFDEAELEKENNPVPPSAVIPSQKDADKKEQEIVNELENIEKEIAEHPEAPLRSMSFNDPLTSMHYDTLDNDGTDEITPLSQPASAESAGRPRRVSERTQKLDEYRKSLRQFTYNKVSTLMTQSPRKERGQHMTLIDQEKVKNFMNEFATRGLLPHIEKLMRNLSEQV